MIKNKNCQQTKEKGELPQSYKGFISTKSATNIIF